LIDETDAAGVAVDDEEEDDGKPAVKRPPRRQRSQPQQPQQPQPPPPPLQQQQEEEEEEEADDAGAVRVEVFQVLNYTPQLDTWRKQLPIRHGEKTTVAVTQNSSLMQGMEAAMGSTSNLAAKQRCEAGGGAFGFAVSGLLGGAAPVVGRLQCRSHGDAATEASPLPAPSTFGEDIVVLHCPSKRTEFSVRVGGTVRVLSVFFSVCLGHNF